MRPRLSSFFACALLAAVSTGSSLRPAGGGANGDPDMTGVWEGTKKYVDTDLSGDFADLKGKCDLRLDLTQTSAVLTGTLTLDCPPFKSEVFPITDGRVGNGHFWFSSGSPVAAAGGAPYLLAEGSVKSNRSLKGTGIILYGPDYTTRMTFSAKRILD